MESASQPEPYTYPHQSLKRTASGTEFERKTIGLTGEDRSKKIEELKDFIQNKLQESNNEFVSEEILTQNETGENIKFFYFIGRLNPPHQGHIETLKELVRIANSESSIPPLILVGSGPGGLRTMDNPIEFITKKTFIEHVLPGSYKIQEMTNPAKNVSDYIEEQLQQLGKDISSIKTITINHIAGGKDDDSIKLDFVKRSAEKRARTIVPDADVATGAIVMPAARSATKVRKDAYQTVLNHSGFDGWPEEYKNFYGDDALEIYTQILEPLNDIPRELLEKSIINYISTGVLPSTSMTTKQPRKKSSSKKRGGTKRRKNKNNKKKTKKRYTYCKK